MRTTWLRHIHGYYFKESFFLGSFLKSSYFLKIKYNCVIWTWEYKCHMWHCIFELLDIGLPTFVVVLFELENINIRSGEMSYWGREESVFGEKSSHQKRDYNNF